MLGHPPKPQLAVVRLADVVAARGRFRPLAEGAGDGQGGDCSMARASRRHPAGIGPWPDQAGKHQGRAERGAFVCGRRRQQTGRSSCVESGGITELKLPAGRDRRRSARPRRHCGDRRPSRLRIKKGGGLGRVAWACRLKLLRPGQQRSPAGLAPVQRESATGGFPAGSSTGVFCVPASALSLQNNVALGLPRFQRPGESAGSPCGTPTVNRSRRPIPSSPPAPTHDPGR